MVIKKVHEVVKAEEIKANKEAVPVVFNMADHLEVDVDDMATIILNTPFGTLTVCAIDFGDGAGTFDIKMHSEKQTKVMGMTAGSTSILEEHSLYVLDVKNKEVN